MQKPPFSALGTQRSNLGRFVALSLLNANCQLPTANELPGIIDQIITYQFLDFGDGKPPVRGFVCKSPNPWGYPAKDRSGRLEELEPPNLGALIEKLTGPGQLKTFPTSSEQSAQT